MCVVLFILPWQFSNASLFRISTGKKCFSPFPQEARVEQKAEIWWTENTTKCFLQSSNSMQVCESACSYFCWLTYFFAMMVVVSILILQVKMNICAVCTVHTRITNEQMYLNVVVAADFAKRKSIYVIFMEVGGNQVRSKCMSNLRVSFIQPFCLHSLCILICISEAVHSYTETHTSTINNSSTSCPRRACTITINGSTSLPSGNGRKDKKHLNFMRWFLNTKIDSVLILKIMIP